MLQLTIWSLPALIGGLAAIGSYIRIRGNDHVPGVEPFAWLSASICVWSFAQVLGLTLTPYTAQLWAAKASYLGIVIAPIAWLGFAMTFVSRRIKLSTGATYALAVVPMLTILVTFTNDSHGWMWSDVRQIASHGVTALVTEQGPWFTVHTAYSYALTVAGTAILAQNLAQSRLHAWPLISVIAAPGVVAIANLITISPINPTPWFDATPAGYAIAALILHFGVLNFGLLDATPVVRHRVVETLIDGVMVVSSEDKIIDMNPTAQTLLNINSQSMRDGKFSELVGNGNLIELANSPRDQNKTEITIDRRAYDISASLLDETDPHSEVVLVFRDITARRKAENRLRNMRMELERLANTDPLTELYNRRFFILRLNEETERVRRHGSELSVLLFDLDHFKKVNDTWGHDVGDKVLVLVSKITQHVKRITDVAARIGGEEFALLLPETDRKGAVRLAQRLRQAIEKRGVKTEQGVIHVTASIGVATVSQNAKEVENLLTHADRALYKAKESGRNMVCSAEF